MIKRNGQDMIGDKNITTQLRGANPQQTKQNTGINDMSENTESGRVSIPLQRELESADVPQPCDKSIFENGTVVAVLECGMVAMEGLVQEACRKGIKMDWHYVGGRAVVKTLDDPLKAREALQKAMPRIIQ